MRLFSFSYKDSFKPDICLGLAEKSQYYHLELFRESKDPVKELFISAGNDPGRIHQLVAQAPRREIREEEILFLPPMVSTQKIICLGLNYRDHALESKRDPPKKPVIFAKFPNALTGHKNPVPLPLTSQQVDYEGELAFYIGRPGKRIPQAQAYSYIAGYTIFNDVSARDFQFGDGQWTRGKSCDSFAPCGPYLVTTDEVPNPHKLNLTTLLNGEVMQNSNTGNLIFTIPEIIEFMSQEMTLLPGDLIATGTPAGVGVFREPPRFLRRGDVVRVRIEGLEELVNEFV